MSKINPIKKYFIFQMLYGLRTFYPKTKWSLLDTYFSNLEVRPAEDHICNFDKDYKTFFDNLYNSKIKKISDYIKQKLNDPNFELPKNKEGKLIVPKELYENKEIGIELMVHQSNFSYFNNYSFPEPWIVMTSGDLDDLEKQNLLKNRAIYDHSDSVGLELFKEGIFLFFTVV